MKREAEISVEQLEKNVELLENQINAETAELL
jgi:signal recognition particle GTPase